MSSAAEAPGRQLARVKNGQAVGAIHLPGGHWILVDARGCPDGKALVTRLNEHRAFCWSRVRYASSVEKFLKRAEGDIQTASSRDKCDPWPKRYRNVGRGSR